MTDVFKKLFFYRRVTEKLSTSVLKEYIPRENRHGVSTFHVGSTKCLLSKSILLRTNVEQTSYILLIFFN